MGSKGELLFFAINVNDYKAKSKLQYLHCCSYFAWSQIWTRRDKRSVIDDGVIFCSPSHDERSVVGRFVRELDPLPQMRCDIKKMSSIIDTLTGSLESRDLPQLGSNVRSCFDPLASWEIPATSVQSLMATVNGIKGSSEIEVLERSHSTSAGECDTVSCELQGAVCFRL